MPEKAKTNQEGAREKSFETIELSMLCHQMALVLKSGIHPVEGVPLIAEEMPNPKLKKALDEIGKSITDGAMFHEALAKQQVFPDYMVSMTRLGEKTGMLDQVMENMADYYDRDYRLRKKFRSSITYPIILLVLMLGVILLLILKILPMFAGILNSLGGQMPPVTQALLNAGQGLMTAGPVLIALILLVCAGVWGYGRSEKGRFAFDRMRLSLPYLGQVYRKLSAARFSHGMAMALKSGMTFETGLEAVEEIIGNRYVRSRIGDVRKRLREGLAPADAFAELGLYPNLFIRMLRVGHKTGELDTMLGRISDVYDDEVDDSLLMLANAIEPLMVIALSAVVAVILLAVMLPLINIMSTIG